MLIFDEVITGFRFARGGAQEWFGVTPDLTTLAKGLGGGFPVAAVGGSVEAMRLIADGTYSQSGTYNANVVQCAAVVGDHGRARRAGTLRAPARPRVPAGRWAHRARRGERAGRLRRRPGNRVPAVVRRPADPQLARCRRSSPTKPCSPAGTRRWWSAGCSSTPCSSRTSSSHSCTPTPTSTRP